MLSGHHPVALSSGSLLLLSNVFETGNRNASFTSL